MAPDVLELNDLEQEAQIADIMAKLEANQEKFQLTSDNLETIKFQLHSITTVLIRWPKFTIRRVVHEWKFDSPEELKPAA